MLLIPTWCGFQWKAYTTPNPSTTPGTSITAGSGTKGSWGQVLSALSNDVYMLELWINAGNSSGAQRDYWIDIGVDPAGGTSYSVLIADIVGHMADSAVAGGRWYRFPIFIKAGSTVGARAQGNGANAIRVAAIAYGWPTNPEAVLVGQYSETLGNGTFPGVSFTPGSSGAEGNWVQVGTTTRNCWWWQIGVGYSGTTLTSLMYYIDLATGDSSNKHMIIENMPVFIRGTAETWAQFATFDGFWEVPAGASLYVRGSCSGTALALNCTVQGIGG